MGPECHVQVTEMHAPYVGVQTLVSVEIWPLKLVFVRMLEICLGNGAFAATVNGQVWQLWHCEIATDAAGPCQEWSRFKLEVCTENEKDTRKKTVPTV